MFKVVYLTKEPEYREAVEDFIRQFQSAGGDIVAHTSGSTGVPKEIRLPKQDIEVSAQATNRRFGISAASRMLCPLSANYIAGKMMIARAMTAGCEVAFCRPSNDFWEFPEVKSYLAGGNVDLLPVVPSQCITFQKVSCNPEWKHHAAGIRNIIIGGAAIPKSTEDSLLRTIEGPTGIFATYGMTETCSHVALRPLGENLFNAMPGISFLTDNRDCLRIVAPDYSFKELQTNDIVALQSSGSFVWKGRHDNVINSGGIKLFPEELERKLEGSLTGRFYIKGSPDPKWGESVTLVIEKPKSGIRLSDDEILSICRKCLSSVEMPGRIEWLDEISLTANGKLKRV